MIITFGYKFRCDWLILWAVAVRDNNGSAPDLGCMEDVDVSTGAAAVGGHALSWCCEAVLGFKCNSQ